MVRKRYINRRFWLSLASFCLILLPLSGCLYMYYRNFHEADGYADVFFFLFVAIYAVDITRSIMKEIDAGKKAAIYQELAEKDLLTGCSNRNAYRNDAEHWKNLHGVLLATFDLNNLKQCNDTLGHTYGDQYITDSAAILQRIFSKYGKVYRIGGDEFCIIIPDGHKCNIDKLLEAMVEEERIYNAASPVIHMQIASGYAVFDAKTDSNMEDIRIRADKKMYENKKALKQAGHVA
jgi:diguanylate cyclase (GGDEF)-like protein